VIPRFPLRRSGYLLLEVILSVIILGMSAMVLLRAYSVSMNTVMKAEIVTTATLLADGLVERLDLEGGSFKQGKESGDFGAGFPGYSWEISVTEQRVRYDDDGVKADDIEPLCTVDVTIVYRRADERAYVPLAFSYHPIRLELFTQKSKFENQLN